MIPSGKLNCLNIGVMRPKFGIAPNPLNIVTSCPCEFWFDGQDTGTISLNVNKVIQWDDKSGNARHVANAVDAQRPTYDPVTGRMTFVAANSTYLRSANFGGDLIQPNTIYVLYKITGALGDTEYVFTGLTGTHRNDIYTQSFRFRIYGGIAFIGNKVTDANDNIHIAEFNGVASNYWINGILEGNGNTGVHALDGITLGAYSGFSNYIDAEVMEVFGYNCLLTPAERTALDAYLTSKWGL